MVPTVEPAKLEFEILKVQLRLCNQQCGHERSLGGRMERLCRVPAGKRVEDKIDSKRPLALVVDDEPLIAMNAVDMLEDLGYRALEASNADSALAVLRENNDIALVFTDIDMPGSMNGLSLAALIDRTWPEIRILIASGRAIPAAGEIPAKARFLIKPYAGHHLALALKGMT